MMKGSQNYFKENVLEWFSFPKWYWFLFLYFKQKKRKYKKLYYDSNETHGLSVNLTICL